MSWSIFSSDNKNASESNAYRARFEETMKDKNVEYVDYVVGKLKISNLRDQQIDLVVAYKEGGVSKLAFFEANEDNPEKFEYQESELISGNIEDLDLSNNKTLLVQVDGQIKEFESNKPGIVLEEDKW